MSIYVNCPRCQGSGKQDTECNACAGTGRRFDGAKCPHCNGLGQRAYDCPICRGSGHVLKS
jgi:DnaJ-class molecular chaperone